MAPTTRSRPTTAPERKLISDVKSRTTTKTQKTKAPKTTEKKVVEVKKKKSAVKKVELGSDTSEEDDEEMQVEEIKVDAKVKSRTTSKKESKIPVDEEELDDKAGFDDEEDAVYLHGFSSGSDEDSSDDDDDGVGKEAEVGLDVSKLPTIAKDDATVKRKLEKAKKNAGPTEEKGVISISRLPHGFYEDQLKGYFSQFGEVTRLRVARNKKTGASKHYAFLEFDSLAVASIVADTMNNYLIHGHLLQCHVVPKDKVHPDLWVGANRKWRKVPRDQIVRRVHNKERTDEQKTKVADRLLKRQEAKKRKLEEAGIKYDFDPVSYKKPKAVVV